MSAAAEQGGRPQRDAEPRREAAPLGPLGEAGRPDEQREHDREVAAADGQEMVQVRGPERLVQLGRAPVRCPPRPAPAAAPARPRQAVGGVRQDWSLALTPRALLKFGADVKQGAADYDYWSQVETESAEAGTVVRTWDTTQVRESPRSTRVGAYVAPRYRLFRSLAVELGLRYDGASHTGDAVFSPRLNLSWQPRVGTSVRGAWGRYSQSQPLAGLQAQDGIDQFFSAERAEHRVIGVERMLPRGLMGRVEVYDRRLSNQRPRFINAAPGIEVFPEINWDRVRIDPERGLARGVELLLARDEARRIDWSVGYALASVTDHVARPQYSTGNGPAPHGHRRLGVSTHE